MTTATQIADLVARQMIQDHIKHCDKNGIHVRDALSRIEEGQNNLWKAITRGREWRFKMVLSVLGFMAILLVGLVAYVWQSSPASAAHDGKRTCFSTHEMMVEWMLKTHAQANIWHGLVRGTTVRLYQSDITGEWTTTAAEGESSFECTFSNGIAGTKLPFIERPVRGRAHD